MERIEFLKNIKAPHIDANSATISGNLTIRGSTIVDKIVNRVVDGAILVMNGSSASNPATMLGEVILTGTARFNGTAKFKENLISAFNVEENQFITDLDCWREDGIYIKDSQVDAIYWIDEDPEDPSALKTLYFYTYDEITEAYFETEVYNNLNGGWQIEIPTLCFKDAEIPTYFIPWYKENFENIEDCVNLEANSAYAILYDPQQEAIRLGKGEYFSDEENPTFNFFEGEGDPIAVRNLTEKDDGRLVVWDADNYSFVKSPMSVGTGNSSIIAGNDFDGKDYFGFPLTVKHRASGEGSFAGGKVELKQKAQPDMGITNDVYFFSEAEGDGSFSYGIGASTKGKYSTSFGKETLAGADGCFAEGEQTEAGISRGWEILQRGSNYICVDVVSGLQMLFMMATSGGYELYFATKKSSFKIEGVTSLPNPLIGTTFKITFSGSIDPTDTIVTLYKKYSDGRIEYIEGNTAVYNGIGAHAEGIKTKAQDRATHSEGEGTIATGDHQHVQGSYNVADSKYLHVVGNGTGDANRSNAHTIDREGNAWFAGNIYTGGDSMDSANSEMLITSGVLTKLLNKLSEKGIEISIDELL